MKFLRRSPIHAGLTGALSILLISGAALAETALRPPVGAGTLYPEDPRQLWKTVTGFIENADVDPPGRKLLACVAPYSAYGLSGAVAGHAFKGLQPGQYDRVIVLAPSQHREFEGCSIAGAAAYQTPLGPVPLDQGAIRRLSYSPLIGVRRLKYGPSHSREGLHEIEHSIEAILPFLQVRLGVFRLVPILVGDLADLNGKYNPNRIAAVVEPLEKILDDRTLVVVAAQFTHYGNDFSFRPFGEVDAEQIEGLDLKLLKPLAGLDAAGFQQVIDKTGVPVTGSGALHVMLQLLPENAHGQLLAYDTSGRILDQKNRSISYAALTYYDPGQPPPEAHAERALPEPRSTPAPEQPADTEGETPEKGGEK